MYEWESSSRNPNFRYVPPPSQNRTWSVTPPGSQLESSTTAWIQIMHNSDWWQPSFKHFAVAFPIEGFALTAAVEPFVKQVAYVIPRPAKKFIPYKHFSRQVQLRNRSRFFFQPLQFDHRQCSQKRAVPFLVQKGILTT